VHVCSTLQHCVLQRVAACCSVLQRKRFCYMWRACRYAECCSVLQHFVLLCVDCNTLQHTATHCNSLQLTATHRNSLQRDLFTKLCTRRSTLYIDQRSCTAIHCNALQRTAHRCCWRGHTATLYSAPQHTATYISATTVVFSAQCY